MRFLIFIGLALLFYQMYRKMRLNANDIERRSRERERDRERPSVGNQYDDATDADYREL